MAEPSHGEILGQIGELKTEVKHLTEMVAEMKKSVDEWQAIKAGAGIARWVVMSMAGLIATVAAVRWGLLSLLGDKS